MRGFIPKYLNQKGNVVKQILGTAVFAILFIAIFQPFRSKEWIPGISDFQYLLVAFWIVLLMTGILSISRMAMQLFSKKHDISYVMYVGWILLELIVMALCYSLLLVNMEWMSQSFLALFPWAFVYTSLILLIPYSLFFLYGSLEQKNKQLSELQASQALQDVQDKPVKLLNFYDEKGDLKLSIRPDVLCYVESADNYVDIHYMNLGHMNHYMLRNTMKAVLSAVGSRQLVRCHRSYMVNLELVKVMRKTEDGMVLDFDIPGVSPIPISKTYRDEVVARFS